jgi:hypothetical protein
MENKETLEEAAENYSKTFIEDDGTSEVDFIEGAKWQAEQNKNKYSEEEVIDLIQSLSMNEQFDEYCSVSKETAKYFLEQFKTNRL